MEWRTDVESAIDGDPDWLGWKLEWISMDQCNNFVAKDIFALVMQAPGPVVVFDCAQTQARENLFERLRLRAVANLVTTADSTTLWERIALAPDSHRAGEPLLPRKYVAAVLLVRKLFNHKYWGGNNNKNFIWADELANGRGVDPCFADIIRIVANDLCLKGILVPKYAGGRRTKGQKYALNIESVYYKGEFFDENLLRNLMRDPSRLPRSFLTR